MDNINIYKTNVDMINNDIQNLILDLKKSKFIYNKSDNNSTTVFNLLSNKYSVLFTTSKTLFTLVLSDVNKVDFDQNSFNLKIKHILDLIIQMQKSKITQNDASENVGRMLAKEFIPNNLS